MQDVRYERPLATSDVAGSPRSGCMVGVLGVYGKGNLGDEALLLCIADDVHACLPDAKILAICSNPETVTDTFGFMAISRSPGGGFISKLRLVRSCHLLIIGGGTLLCDHNDFMADVKAMGSYFFWPMLARLFGVPTIAYAQGVGPATHRVIRQAIRRFLPRMADGTFRDSASAQLAREMVDGCQWPATCDPVVGGTRFLPERITTAASAKVQRWMKEVGDYALVALRYPKLVTMEAHREYLERSASAIVAFQARSGAHLVLFPAHISEQYQDDRACLDHVKRALLAAGTHQAKISVAIWDDLADAAAILQNARVAIGDRLHALLLAAMNGVPVVGLAVENKIGGCLDEIGHGRACRVMSPTIDDPELIAITIFEAWSARPEERLEHNAAVARWRSMHHENLARLQRLLL
jgi:polysaccharide pyruvyl transferase WcaK-like protein